MVVGMSPRIIIQSPAECIVPGRTDFSGGTALPDGAQVRQSGRQRTRFLPEYEGRLAQRTVAVKCHGTVLTRGQKLPRDVPSTYGAPPADPADRGTGLWPNVLRLIALQLVKMGSPRPHLDVPHFGRHP